MTEALLALAGTELLMETLLPWNNAGWLGGEGGGALYRGLTQSDNRQIYFNLKNTVHIVKFYVSELC